MPYTPLTEDDRRRILDSIGARSFEDLLDPVPENLRLKGPLRIPRGMTEQALTRHIEALAGKNTTGLACFLGAGAYNHYIPSVVDSVVSRSEFLTSYTPYQPEVSQGTLQAIFEYQTLVCQLTGMDVTNASLYDGASSVAEAVLMAMRITGRTGVVLSAALHPEYRSAVKTYLGGHEAVVKEALYCTEAGTTPAEGAAEKVDEETACLVVQSPNFFGSIEDIETLSRAAHERGALLVTVVAEPVSLGLLKSPASLGADMAAGEMSSFGNFLNYGGPFLGFLATREKFVRQMPGRIVGETVDSGGKRAFCLTFATREQHIRRERATSNICTNEGLCALAAAVHMTSLGRDGLKALATINLSAACYLKKKLLDIDGISPLFRSPTFNEFAIKIEGDADRVLSGLLERGIIGGLRLERFYPELKGSVLVAVTEMNTKEEMDIFSEELLRIVKG